MADEDLPSMKTTEGIGLATRIDALKVAHERLRPLDEATRSATLVVARESRHGPGQVGSSPGGSIRSSGRGPARLHVS